MKTHNSLRRAGASTEIKSSGLVDLQNESAVSTSLQLRLYYQIRDDTDDKYK